MGMYRKMEGRKKNWHFMGALHFTRGEREREREGERESKGDDRCIVHCYNLSNIF